MTPSSAGTLLGHRLLQLGMLLFLIGLLTGFAIPQLANPRMGLASHLEAVMNGLFLIVLGLVWPRLLLSARLLSVLFWLAAYGTFANWMATLLAAAWGAGGTMMPLAASGFDGTSLQEAVIAALLLSLSAAIVAASGLAIWGLRTSPQS
ncbi:MAG: hypothetical protein Q8L86_14980 [Vicinamibacterales bacterium]|nr:hypothetical protein [Vicinamibacterales bacterium]